MKKDRTLNFSTLNCHVRGRHFIDILEPVLGSLVSHLFRCRVFYKQAPQASQCRNIIRGAIPGAPKRQKVPMAFSIRFVVRLVYYAKSRRERLQCQVAFAMEKASVVDLPGPVKHAKHPCSLPVHCLFTVSLLFCQLILFCQRPQAASCGAVQACLGRPLPQEQLSCAQNRPTCILPGWDVCPDAGVDVDLDVPAPSQTRADEHFFTVVVTGCKGVCSCCWQ